MPSDTDSTIRQIEFELEKAERGMAMPYDAERVGRLLALGILLAINLAWMSKFFFGWW